MTTSNGLSDFQDLWDDPDWTVLELEGSRIIIHRTRGVARLIEDDDLNERVCEELIRRGRELLREPPASMTAAIVGKE